MSSDLLADLRRLIIREDQSPDDVNLLGKIEKRLEWLELTNNTLNNDDLKRRIEVLESEVKLLHECASTMRESSKVAEEARAVLASVADDDRRVRDTRKGEWPEDGDDFLVWGINRGYWIHLVNYPTGDDARIEWHRWLPAPPPPTED